MQETSNVCGEIVGIEERSRDGMSLPIQLCHLKDLIAEAQSIAEGIGSAISEFLRGLSDSA